MTAKNYCITYKNYKLVGKLFYTPNGPHHRSMTRLPKLPATCYIAR